MFLALLADPYLDILKLDENLAKPRDISVIFSAFHKILFKKEKYMIERGFRQDVQKEYIDFLQVKHHKIQRHKRMPLIVTNKIKKSNDISEKPERFFLKNQLLDKMNILLDDYIDDGVRISSLAP